MKRTDMSNVLLHEAPDSERGGDGTLDGRLIVEEVPLKQETDEASRGVPGVTRPAVRQKKPKILSTHLAPTLATLSGEELFSSSFSFPRRHPLLLVIAKIMGPWLGGMGELSP
jgi:hypothetical protein